MWAIIDPLEIYNSKPFLSKTWNDSSRWVCTSRIKTQIDLPNEYIGNDKNVYLASPKTLKETLSSNSIKSKYYLMSSVKMSAERIIVTKSDKNEYKRLRQNFRKMLLNSGGNNLIGSSIKNESLLIASHIERVEDIIKSEIYTEEEKKNRISDPDNGLLIPKGLDALFDKYLITFNDNWEIIISKNVTSEEVLESCNLSSLEGPLIKGKGLETIKYLEIHREKAMGLYKFRQIAFV